MFESLFDILVNIDKYATYIVSEYQIWTYAILFVVIFMETGLVITPFLPGDSLLFVVGSLSALPGTPLDVNIIALVVFIAAVLGDTCNYFVGHYMGQRCFANRNSKIFKRSYLTRTHAFFNKYGGKTIIFARFIPIVRTLAPFVAGIGKMSYGKFISFNAIGGIVWVLGVSSLGYFFGNIPVVKKNFEIVIIAIIFISVLPVAIEILKSKMKKSKEEYN